MKDSDYAVGEGGSDKGQARLLSAAAAVAICAATSCPSSRSLSANCSSGVDRERKSWHATLQLTTRRESLNGWPTCQHYGAIWSHGGMHANTRVRCATPIRRHVSAQVNPPNMVSNSSTSASRVTCASPSALLLLVRACHGSAPLLPLTLHLPAGTGSGTTLVFSLAWPDADLLRRGKPCIHGNQGETSSQQGSNAWAGGAESSTH